MPSNVREQSLTENSQGLVTFISAADQSKSSFRVLQNARQRKFGLIENLLGRGTAQIRVNGTLTNVPALPSSFTPEKAWVFHATVPSDSDYVLLFGSKASRDRFYVWPDITSRAFDTSSDWLELTEGEAGTITASGSSTSMTVTGLAQATTNYYANWWVLVYDSTGVTFRGADYVLSNTSGGVLTTKFGVSGITTSPADIIVLMRFPVFKKASSLTAFYQVDDLPTIRKDGEALTIFTGSHSIDDGPDLWLGIMGNATTDDGIFNDASFDYNGWYFTHAHPWRLVDNLLITSSAASGSSSDPIPWTAGSEFHVLDLTGVYDDDQESRPRFDKYDNNAGLNDMPNVAEITAADQDIDLGLSINLRTDLPRRSDQLAGTAVGSSILPIWDRRIKKIRVYIADGIALNYAAGDFQAVSDHFFIKEISVDDSNWTLSGGAYIQTVTLTGSEYRAAQEFPHAKVNGYQIQRAGANAKFGTQVGNRSVIGPVFDDTKKLYRAIYSPIRYSGNAGINVIPWGFRLDVTQYENEIAYLTEYQGKLIIMSPRRLMTAYVTGENKGQILESYQRKGLASYRTVKVIEGLLYFSSLDSPLEIFDGSNFLVPSPGYFIKDIWDALTPAQKAASFSGYYHIGKLYVIKMGTRIFLYDVEQQIWAGEYVPSDTFVDFVEGYDGQLYGATATTFVELFHATPSESLAIALESKVFNGLERDVVKARLQYKSDVLLKWIPVDDTQPSTLRENDAVLFLPQSNMESQDVPVSLKTTRFAVKLTSTASTDGNIEIEDLGFAETIQPEK